MKRAVITFLFLGVIMSCYSAAGIPYCSVDPTIQAFLRENAFGFNRKMDIDREQPFKLKLMRDSRLPSRRLLRLTRAAVTTRWPYDCKHAGLNYEERLFEVETYQCCEVCRRPFTACVAKSQRHAMYWCPSNALRCIARCIQKHGYRSIEIESKYERKQGHTMQQKTGYGRGSSHTLAARKHMSLKQVVDKAIQTGSACKTTKKRLGNSYCIERSCIPM